MSGPAVRAIYFLPVLRRTGIVETVARLESRDSGQVLKEISFAVVAMTLRYAAARPGPDKGFAFGLAVIASSLAVFAIGSRIIKHRAAASITPFSRQVASER